MPILILLFIIFTSAPSISKAEDVAPPLFKGTGFDSDGYYGCAMARKKATTDAMVQCKNTQFPFCTVTDLKTKTITHNHPNGTTSKNCFYEVYTLGSQTPPPETPGMIESLLKRIKNTFDRKNSNCSLTNDLS